MAGMFGWGNRKNVEQAVASKNETEKGKSIPHVTGSNVRDILQRIVNTMDSKEKAIHELAIKVITRAEKFPDQRDNIFQDIKDIIEKLSPSQNNWNAIFVLLWSQKFFLVDRFVNREMLETYLKEKADIYLDDNYIVSQLKDYSNQIQTIEKDTSLRYVNRRILGLVGASNKPEHFFSPMCMQTMSLLFEKEAKEDIQRGYSRTAFSIISDDWEIPLLGFKKLLWISLILCNFQGKNKEEEDWCQLDDELDDYSSDYWREIRREQETSELIFLPKIKNMVKSISKNIVVPEETDLSWKSLEKVISLYNIALGKPSIGYLYWIKDVPITEFLRWLSIVHGKQGMSKLDIVNILLIMRDRNDGNLPDEFIELLVDNIGEYKIKEKDSVWLIKTINKMAVSRNKKQELLNKSIVSKPNAIVTEEEEPVRTILTAYIGQPIIQKIFDELVTIYLFQNGPSESKRNSKRKIWMLIKIIKSKHPSIIIDFIDLVQKQEIVYTNRLLDLLLLMGQESNVEIFKSIVSKGFFYIVITLIPYVLPKLDPDYLNCMIKKLLLDSKHALEDLKEICSTAGIPLTQDNMSLALNIDVNHKNILAIKEEVDFLKINLLPDQVESLVEWVFSKYHGSLDKNKFDFETEIDFIVKLGGENSTTYNKIIDRIINLKNEVNEKNKVSLISFFVRRQEALLSAVQMKTLIWQILSKLKTQHESEDLKTVLDDIVQLGGGEKSIYSFLVDNILDPEIKLDIYDKITWLNFFAEKRGTPLMAQEINRLNI